MKKIALMIILGLMVNICINIFPVSSLTIEKNSIYDLYVDDDGTADYTSIQDAINNASNGDTIFVYNGTYYENVVINKKIKLIGENKNSTVINGESKGDTVSLNAENIIIERFTIINGKTNIRLDISRAGIRVTESNCIIKENIIKNNYLGIFALRVTNLTICENKFYNDGITFSPYENEARPPCLEEYFTHNIQNNTVNNEKMYYLKDQKNINISNEDIGQIIMMNCTNITIKNVTITRTDSGIQMAFCNKCKIINTNISYNTGIWTFKSCENIFEYNIFSNNFHGITLDYSSNNNLVARNMIFKNQMAGIMIEYYSIYNIVTENNFINNTYSGYFTQAFRNKWDQNYYSDWIGLKFKKLGFLPKLILGRPLDLYPKFGKWFKMDLHPAKTPYNI